MSTVKFSNPQVALLVGKVDPKDSFEPLFNVLNDSYISWKHQYMYGDQIKMTIDKSDLAQVQDIIGGGKKYLLKRVTDIYQKS